MAYRLHVTSRAEELLDGLIAHLLYRLCSEQAARHLLDSIDDIYVRLEDNPLQFPYSRDSYLSAKGYHEALVPQMSYVIVFDVRGDVVNIVGIFHQLENYPRKL